MTDDPREQDEANPKRAVEIDEEALDAAAGGLNNKNPELLSIKAGQKVAPQGVVGTALGAEAHIMAEWGRAED